MKISISTRGFAAPYPKQALLRKPELLIRARRLTLRVPGSTTPVTIDGGLDTYWAYEQGNHRVGAFLKQTDGSYLFLRVLTDFEWEQAKAAANHDPDYAKLFATQFRSTSISTNPRSNSMKILLSRVSESATGNGQKTNVTAQAQALVRNVLGAPVAEARTLIQQGVSIASRRLKKWAEDQVAGDPMSRSPEIALCKKILSNPVGIATQLANSMVMAQVVIPKPKVDVLLDPWERSILSGDDSEEKMTYPDLDTFLVGQQRAAYIKEGTFLAYVRKGPKIVKVGSEAPHKTVLTLTLANLHADGREANSEESQSPAPTGNFKPFMDKLEHEAKAKGYACVYVESVLNGFLPKVLAKRGYLRCNEDHSTLNFVKFFT